jgi:4-amino-4-deoxy-L-arabinose transferase-like glycosyltransferase
MTPVALRRALGWPRLPYALLAVVVCASVAGWAFRLEQPCDGPCKGTRASLIFDEAFYVNAARRIADEPADREPDTYARAPAKTDPNAEHPQLAKLVMAGGIELFGDRPLAYRLPSMLAGVAALLLMFALVRAAGGSPWLALGATSVMAADNLFFVHGRIAMLDIYVLAFMLGGVLLYLRDRPALAGLVLGIGASAKLVGIYALFIVGLLELGRRIVARRREDIERDRSPLDALGVCIAVTLVAYAVSLELLDLAVPAYDPGTGERYTNVLEHTRHMLDYAVKLTNSPGGPSGIASYPWTWLTGRGTIPYLTVAEEARANGEVIATHTEIAFRGALNPFLLFVTLPALFAVADQAWRRGRDVDLLALAWFAGTMVPFTLQAIFQERTTYVFYLLATLPALCIAAARLFSLPGIPRAVTVGWALALVVGFVDLFPFRTLL